MCRVGWLITAVLMWGLFAYTALAEAGDVTLEWDAVTDARVANYEVHYGLAAKTYTGKQVVPKTATSARVSDLAPKPWFFAVRACNADITICSDFSNEVTTTVPAPIATPKNMRVTGVSVNVTFGPN